VHLVDVVVHDLDEVGAVRPPEEQLALQFDAPGAPEKISDYRQGDHQQSPEHQYYRGDVVLDHDCAFAPAPAM
jgi:hypothetical protein